MSNVTKCQMSQNVKCHPLFISKQSISFLDDLSQPRCYIHLRWSCSFKDPVGHNIWWENRRNGSFGRPVSPIFQSCILSDGTYERIKKLRHPPFKLGEHIWSPITWEWYWNRVECVFKRIPDENTSRLTNKFFGAIWRRKIIIFFRRRNKKISFQEFCEYCCLV